MLHVFVRMQRRPHLGTSIIMLPFPGLTMRYGVFPMDARVVGASWYTPGRRFSSTAMGKLAKASMTYSSVSNNQHHSKKGIMIHRLKNVFTVQKPLHRTTVTQKKNVTKKLNKTKLLTRPTVYSKCLLRRP